MFLSNSLLSFCSWIIVNELGDLAEDRDAVLSRVLEKAKEMDPKKLSRAVSLYGKYSTQKKFKKMLQYASGLFST